MTGPSAPVASPARDGSAARRFPLKGVASLLASAAFLAVSSAFAKTITENGWLGSLEITFIRFLLGVLVMGGYALARKKTLRPVKPRYVVARAVTNALSIILFFLGIQYSTVTKANMLNMSYPLFVYALAPLLNREKVGPSFLLYLAASIGGIYLIVVPDFRAINLGDLFALASGVLGGVATIALRDARKYDESHLIVFWLMAAGAFINFFLVIPSFRIPPRESLLPLGLSFATGLAGQTLVTVGFRYVPAAPGSLISTSRMIFAVAIGVLMFGDPLNLPIAAGGLLILASLVAVSGIFSRAGKRNAPPAAGTGGA